MVTGGRSASTGQLFQHQIALRQLPIEPLAELREVLRRHLEPRRDIRQARLHLSGAPSRCLDLSLEPGDARLALLDRGGPLLQQAAQLRQIGLARADPVAGLVDPHLHVADQRFPPLQLLAGLAQLGSQRDEALFQRLGLARQLLAILLEAAFGFAQLPLQLGDPLAQLPLQLGDPLAQLARRGDLAARLVQLGGEPLGTRGGLVSLSLQIFQLIVQPVQLAGVLAHSLDQLVPRRFRGLGARLRLPRLGGGFADLLLGLRVGAAPRYLILQITGLAGLALVVELLGQLHRAGSRRLRLPQLVLELLFQRPDSDAAVAQLELALLQLLGQLDLAALEILDLLDQAG